MNIDNDMNSGYNDMNINNDNNDNNNSSLSDDNVCIVIVDNISK